MIEASFSGRLCAVSLQKDYEHLVTTIDEADNMTVSMSFGTIEVGRNIKLFNINIKYAGRDPTRNFVSWYLVTLA